MSTEHRCNDTDRGILKYWGKIRSDFHFFHHKCYINWRGTRGGGAVLFPCFKLCILTLAVVFPMDKKFCLSMDI